jgi:transcriptional regulator with XRE-family HTH domain
LGQIIRARRRQLDLTQKEVAERIKTSISFIGYLELGKRRFSVRTMARLAKVLNLDERGLLFLAQRRLDAMLNRTLDSPVLSSWERFKNDDLLRRRHSISDAEMGMLSSVASLGEVPSLREFIYVLNAIRYVMRR